MEKELATNVWQMSGFVKSYTAGLLLFKDGQVSFLTQQGQQFKVPLSEVQNIKWPALQFGYGVHLDVNGKTYKLTFSQPAGENSFDPGMITDVGRIAMGVDSIRGLMHLKEYKANANQWKEVFKK
jgi:hypothetical protein